MSDSKQSSFAPLKQKLFLVLWIATVIGNVGSFIRDVASGWLVTDLSASPAAVSLIQAAATLPIFLLAIPAGVMADILDRRKFLISIQFILAFASFSLMTLSATGLQSVVTLVLFTFIGGIGVALMGPTWQAIVPELVERKSLKDAVALNSLGVNIARAVGPAIGGVILAQLGAAFSYGMDVISYLFVISALLWWKREAKDEDALLESFGSAFRAGLRYAKSSRDLHRVLFRTVLFFVFASALWALLPLVARKLLNGTAGFYGLLLASVGVGAIAGAIILPKLRERLNTDQLLLLSAIISTVVMCFLSMSPPKFLAVIGLFLLGIGWITSLTTLNSTAQSILPNWVRGRSLAIYLTAFNGAMTLGSLIWGGVAQYIGISLTLIVSGIGLTLVTLLAYKAKLPQGNDDLSPSKHWEEPEIVSDIDLNRSPVLIQVEYRVKSSDKENFLKKIKQLSEQRRKDGAYAWGIVEDTSDPEIMLEWFLVESWAEHLRQHHRVSKIDAQLQAEVNAFHISEKPQIRHFVGFLSR
ncbi:transmembrane secretion effector, major facilitator superfamily [Campylobacter blaseri]|uniref:MFS transporter n=1 Tax=Campylobacter blaseri TaxID=2042961 RepID=A0A2P8QYU4_9BACT|nr:MFS transporter [Campylobacter blaseri]PSM51428.1 MFS transporter [Campylobacter blaseri]PSM52877.1 MFS transporter [Campylobacter blaseri]QKF86182.1 transmembrane secretion effector, major facilitator superfamily [Campylobacter blaseri]